MSLRSATYRRAIILFCSRAAVMVMLLACVASSSFAALVAQDHFAVGGAPNYTATDTPTTASPEETWLVGQNPTAFGFDGAWTENAGNRIVMSNQTNLSIAGYASLSGSGSAYVTQSDPAFNARRAFSATAASEIAGSSSVWWSFLIQRGNTGGTNRVGLTFSNGGAAYVGQRLNSYQVVGRNNDSDPNVVEEFGDSGFDANTNYLIVGQLLVDPDGTNPETIRLWALTDTADFDPLAPIFEVTGNILNAGDLITGIHINPNNSPTYFDALRVGTDALSVIPEPASGMLLVLGSAACLSRRRRKASAK